MLIGDQLKQQENFTQTEKRIADYLEKNFQTAVNMTIEELAKKTYTSHSAIIRMCKKLGYSGFKTFKHELSREVYRLQQQLNESIDPNFPFSQADDPKIIAEKIAELTTRTVKRTQIQIESQDLELFADYLYQAERVFIFAKGDSQVTARSFQSKLVKLNKFFILAEEYSNSSWNAAHLTSKDCALFVSYSGRIHHYEKLMAYFNQNGIPALLLTGNPSSTLAKQAKHKIITAQEEYDFAKVATFSSQISFDYILNTLFSILYAKDFQKNILDLKEKQEVMQKGLLTEYRPELPPL